jgi:hypothetical protein
MGDRKAVLKVTYEVIISGFVRLIIGNAVALLCCVVFNIFIFDDIRHGAAFELFVQRLSGETGP